MGQPERAAIGRVYELPRHDEFDLSNFNPEATMAVMDKVITEIYLPYRGQKGFGTERAILVEKSHLPHRENLAEHTTHLGLTAIALWSRRDSLGIKFPDGFDIGKAALYAFPHDAPEVRFGDVDAMTHDKDLLKRKAAGEHAAAAELRTEHPELSGVMDIWEEYELKSNHESRYINDLDKTASTRMIYLDKGKRWHSWEGKQTSREHMTTAQRRKLLTPLGFAIFDAIERDLDKHPEYFPAIKTPRTGLKGVLLNSISGGSGWRARRG